MNTSTGRQDYVFTSESVSEGHPDKVCDRISDEIVDLVFREAKKTGMDPSLVRIACESRRSCPAKSRLWSAH